MPRIQAVTAMTLDGFLPDTDNMSMRWVMNHRKGFAHWRERCDARILPHSILDLLCEKDGKGNTFTYLAEVSDSESLELLRGLSLLQPRGRTDRLPASHFLRRGNFHTKHSSYSAMAVA